MNLGDKRGEAEGKRGGRSGTEEHFCDGTHKKKKSLAEIYYRFSFGSVCETAEQLQIER